MLRFVRILLLIVVFYSPSVFSTGIFCNYYTPSDSWGDAYDSAHSSNCGHYWEGGHNRDVWACLIYTGGYNCFTIANNPPWQDWDNDGIPDDRDPIPPPSCSSDQIALNGQCLSVGMPAILAGASTAMQWVMENGKWVAKSVESSAVASELDRLLKMSRVPLSELDKLLTKPSQIGLSEFEKLLLKPAATAVRVGESSGLISRAIPVIGPALTVGSIGYGIYELGNVIFDENKTKEYFNDSCPSGFSGPGCNVADGPATVWPSDNKPTYIYKPNDVQNPLQYHPRDDDRDTIDLTNNGGTWEYIHTSDGRDVDVLFVPNLGDAGPSIITFDYDADGTLVSVETPNNGGQKFWHPNMPTDISYLGLPYVIDPPLYIPGPVDDCAIFKYAMTMTDVFYQDCMAKRRTMSRPRSIRGPEYQPYPSPMQGQETAPEPLTQPLPAPAPAPEATRDQNTDPNPNPSTSPYTMPNINTSPAPSTSPQDSPSICGCDLSLPSPQADTFAQTTDKFMDRVIEGMGLNSLNAPDLTGVCPLLEIDTTEHWFGVLSTDVHCQLIESNRALIQMLELILWSIIAFYIVLSA